MMFNGHKIRVTPLGWVAMDWGIPCFWINLNEQLETLKRRVSKILNLELLKIEDPRHGQTI